MQIDFNELQKKDKQVRKMSVGGEALSHRPNWPGVSPTIQLPIRC